MPRIKIEIDKRQLAAAATTVGLIGKRLNRDVLVPAVNDTVKQVRTRLSRRIRDKVAITKNAIDKQIKADRASESRRPTGSITLSESARLGLGQFGASQTKRGVTYRIEKDGGRKLVPHAFIAKPKKHPEAIDLGGKALKRVGGYVRATKGRYVGKMRQKLQRLFGVSPWGVFVVAGLENETIDDAQQLLDKNVERRINFLLLKAEGKI